MNEYFAPEPLSIQALAINLLLGFAASPVVAFFYAHFGESLTDRRRLPDFCRFSA